MDSVHFLDNPALCVGLLFSCGFFSDGLTFPTSPVAFAMISSEHCWSKKLVTCWMTRKFKTTTDTYFNWLFFMTTLTTAQTPAPLNQVDIVCGQVWTLAPRYVYWIIPSAGICSIVCSRSTRSNENYFSYII